MQTTINRIKYEPTKDKQESNMIGLVIWSLRGRRVDAFECSIIARKEFGLVIDWHEFSNALDHMCNEGKVKFIAIGKSGAAVYQP